MQPFSRQTKYTTAIFNIMQSQLHATNAQIWHELKKVYPDVSLTTVHRITARLVERGKLALAPLARDNSARFDANTTPHDHFECIGCGNLRDMNMPTSLLSQLQKTMGDCKFSGHINIQGECAHCLHKEEA